MRHFRLRENAVLVTVEFPDLLTMASKKLIYRAIAADEVIVWPWTLLNILACILQSSPSVTAWAAHGISCRLGPVARAGHAAQNLDRSWIGRTLRGILAKIRPEPVREPLPPPKV